MNLLRYVDIANWLALVEKIEPQFDREHRAVMATPNTLHDPEGEHTETIAPVEKASEADTQKGLQPWTDIPSAIKAAKLGIPVVRDILEKIRDPEHSRIKLSIKPPDSILNKIQRLKKEGRTIRSIHDVLRCALLCADQDAVNLAVQKLKKIAKVIKVDFKNDQESEEALKDVPKEDKRHMGYFGSYHIDILVPVKIPDAPADAPDGIITELQILTRHLMAFKKIGHQIYDKHRNLPAFNYERQKKGLPPLDPQKAAADFERDARHSRHLYRSANQQKKFYKPNRKQLRMRDGDDLSDYF